MITESYRDFTRKRIRSEFASLAEFLRSWSATKKKQAIIELLEENGIILENLADEVGKDNYEKALQELELLEDNYESPLPEYLRWRSWAMNPEGKTGDELSDFVNLQLFPTLKDKLNTMGVTV